MRPRLAITSRSPEATRSLGERLGRAAAPGDVFLLEGGFGVGKTVFVQGLAAGLGVPTHVTSPSFVIVNQHRGRLTLYHVDLYRLEQRDPDLEGSLEEMMEAGGVVAVEWPGLLPPELRAGAAVVRLERLDDETRRIELETDQPRLLARLRRVAARPARAASAAPHTHAAGEPEDACRGPEPNASGREA